MDDLKFQPISFSPDDLAFLEQTRAIDDQVVRSLGVPADLLRGEPTGLFALMSEIGHAMAVEAYTASLLSTYQKTKPAPGPGYTPPISRKFFPPRWGHV